MIHALQLLGALMLTMVGVWVLQLFIYSLGGYLLNGRNLAQNLYDAAKVLDPGRPVMTVDGI